jgi:Rrf2 family nitric oxide-sensitive transcriptional repressor
MLKVSKKWWYALKAVLYVAENNNELIKISDLSNNLNISESLLRRIISNLDKSGIVMTIKWRVWGVKLWLEAKDISVYDILNSVGEELWIVDCTKWLMCENSENCSTTTLFWNLQKSFNWILKLQTLDKIIKEKKN